MRALRPDQGKPAAALALIATIFAIAFTIKLLPPATRQALLPVVQETLPHRALLIWSAIPEGVPSVAAPTPKFSVRENSLIIVSAQPTPAEPTAAVQLTFDVDPGEPPLISATPSTAVALPMTIGAVHPELEISNSPLVMPFTKTGSALRVAFVKTGSAIKAAASGTAGVFVSNP